MTKKDTTNPKDLIGATKPPISLIPGSALVEEAMAMKLGADKYGAFNWRDKKVQARIYCDALLRHTLAYIDGEDIDSESGVSHLAHARACLGILIDAKENDCLIDDRPKKGVTNKIIARNTKNKPVTKHAREEYLSTLKDEYLDNNILCSTCSYDVRSQAHKIVCSKPKGNFCNE